MVHHIGRMLGAQNMVDFSRPVQPQIMPDDAVQNEVAAGNLIPMPQPSGNVPGGPSGFGGMM